MEEIAKQPKKKKKKREYGIYGHFHTYIWKYFNGGNTENDFFFCVWRTLTNYSTQVMNIVSLQE